MLMLFQLLSLCQNMNSKESLDECKVKLYYYPKDSDSETGSRREEACCLPTISCI